MDFIIDFILHIDQHMINIVQAYHLWTYAILFLIIFCETGLVVTPFLPGDSLLFVAGAIAAQPDMPLEVNVLVLIVFAAAVLGQVGRGVRFGSEGFAFGAGFIPRGVLVVVLIVGRDAKLADLG